MSLDFLQVGGNRTYVRAPDTSISAALTSVTAGVALGAGFDVTDSGKIAGRFDPAPHFEPFSLSTASVIPTGVSTFVRVANVAASTITHAIAAAGTKDGQVAIVVNGSAQAIKWAYPASTSLVASAGPNPSGTSAGELIPANSSATLVWSAYHSRWYQA